MAVTTLKAAQIVQSALGLLVREMTLPALVWRSAPNNFAGALNDTISLRLPAYVEARTRALRSGASRVKDNLAEQKVDISLNTDIYLDVAISDEQLTLDIVDFSAQVLNPMIAGVVRKYESLLANTIANAGYTTTISFNSSTQDPYDIAVAARTALNNAYVPYAGRVIAVGSEMEAAFLKSPRFINASASGTTSTLREAVIGRVAGFDVVSSPAIAPNRAYAFHQTAFALASAVPQVPAGAPYGAIGTYQGLAIRVVRVFDPDAVEDRLVLDAWTGSTAVKDPGHFTADPAAGGTFVPQGAVAETGHSDAWANDGPKMVRGVEIDVS